MREIIQNESPASKRRLELKKIYKFTPKQRTL